MEISFMSLEHIVQEYNFVAIHACTFMNETLNLASEENSLF